MAESPAHRFGQIIGEVIEAAIQPVLEKFARDYHLYLDKHGQRPCRSEVTCTWLDLNGNEHDLDFVLERGGSPTKVGMPVAFIETAWRRYTKHSKNKAQEIQGAIEPLAQTYRNSNPFKGAVLAGAFTANAVTQMKSLGFTVLYFPYESVVTVFQRFGIDADSTEDTPDSEFQSKVDAYEALTVREKAKIAKAIIAGHRSEVQDFVRSLAVVVSRQIERIVILALHGGAREVITVDDAIQFIESYEDDGRGKPVERYEIEVRYNNGDSIEGKFKDKMSAIEFLLPYRPVSPKVV